MENEKEELRKEENKEEIKETKNNSEQKEDKKTDDNKEQMPKDKKDGFFKKLWNSITKIEKYPEMAAQGLGKAFTYICKVVAILAIILCLGMIYQAYQMYCWKSNHPTYFEHMNLLLLIYLLQHQYILFLCNK